MSWVMSWNEDTPISVRIDGDPNHPHWNGRTGIALGPSIVDGSSRVRFNGSPFVFSIKNEYIYPERERLPWLGGCLTKEAEREGMLLE